GRQLAKGLLGDTRGELDLGWAGSRLRAAPSHVSHRAILAAPASAAVLGPAPVGHRASSRDTEAVRPERLRRCAPERVALAVRQRPAAYRACGSFAEPRLVLGADGGGTTGPMSPSGAWSRSTITGAWSLGPVPLRACRSTQAARTRPATGALASTRSIRMPRSWWNIPARESQ